MCTLGVAKTEGRFIVFKNRDLSFPRKTWISKRRGALLVRDIFGNCEGINRHGICITKATLHPAGGERYVRPSRVVKGMLDCRTLREALAILERSSTAGNFILSDGRSAVLVEKIPSRHVNRRVERVGTLTNHAISLEGHHGYADPELRAWSRARYARAKAIIEDVKSIEDAQRFLSDTQGWPDRSIFSGKPWRMRTRCSMIYDPLKREVWFGWGGPAGEFKHHARTLTPRADPVTRTLL